MEIVYLLVPLAVLIAVVIVVIFLWAVKSGQFDDLEGPAHRILMDEDNDRPRETGEGAPGNDENTNKP